MSFLRFRRARTRIALSGALVSAVFLVVLAVGARTLIRRLAFEEVDGELDTLATAIGSDYELLGLEETERQALKAGLEANMFEFRLENHSAILFHGEVPVALTGDLLRSLPSVSLAPYRNRPEKPYTAIEPYSGQSRTCRFLVTPLQGKAKGATLVLFRWIGPTLRSLARVDRALAGIVLLGVIGTALILALAVSRAIRPVEEVTRLAEEAEATDLSRRVEVSSGGEEFRRLSAVINSLFDRLERAFRAQRRLTADAAHELKTPTAVLLGEAQDALRPEATEAERRRSLETIAEVSRGLAREVDGLMLLARGDAAPPRPWRSSTCARSPKTLSPRPRRSARAAASSAPFLAKARPPFAAKERGCPDWFPTSSPTPSFTPLPTRWSRSGSERGRAGPSSRSRTTARAFPRRTGAASSSASCDSTAPARNTRTARAWAWRSSSRSSRPTAPAIEVRENEGGGAVFRVTFPAA